MNKFLRDESGLELSEYAVAAALITAAIVLAIAVLGNTITDKVDTLANLIAP
jgi:Flp pilus assembly pilin Flp